LKAKSMRKMGGQMVSCGYMQVLENEIVEFKQRLRLHQSLYKHHLEKVEGFNQHLKDLRTLLDAAKNAATT